MTYRIRQVDASDDDIADAIHAFNRAAECAFPNLSEDELEGFNCFWWLAYHRAEPVGFAGVVPSKKYPGVGYLKRSYVAPDHRGRGLQLRFFRVRENKARKIGWRTLISETTNTTFSANNFVKAGYRLFDPDEPWAFKNSLYWRKDL